MLRRLLRSNTTRAPKYFAFAKITDPTEKAAVTSLYNKIKDAGIYDRLDRLFLCSPTSESAAKIDFINLISLTSFGATFSTLGWQTDASTAYLDSAGWKPDPTSSDKVSLYQGTCAGLYLTDGELQDLAGGAMMGVYSNALTQCDYMTVTGDIGSHAATAFQYDLLTTSISTSFIPTLTMQGQWSMARNGPTAGSHHYLFRVYWGGTEYIAKDNTTRGHV